MKRYIRSDAYERLKYIDENGKDAYLPTWYKDASDEELENLKQILINSPKSSNVYHPVEIDERDLRRQLREDGWTRKSDIDEIIYMIKSGMTEDSAIQRQLQKYHEETDSIHASMDLEEVEDAILNGRPFELEDYKRYKGYIPEEGAIRADEIQVGDVIRNTEDASEIDLNDIFEVLAIIETAPGWEEFDLTFRVRNLTLDPPMEQDLHYMSDEYVGVIQEEEIL